MSEPFVYSKILPLYSIINPDVHPKDYLDVESPFSFFDFLKFTKANATPIQFNDLYVEYIKEWNEYKKKSKSNADTLIHDRYVELLKEITIKHTTLEEKRFLANADYEDELDLDVIIPFFSKKITEICDFYTEKREKLKFKIEKNKLKGTSTSVEKCLYENITDIVFSDELEIANYQKLVNESDLLNNLDIEIEELYDIYTSYLDNDPKETYETYDVKTELRKKLYSANINEIDSNIFLNFDKAVAEQIFKNVRIFLTEIGKKFTINYNFDAINLNCNPNEKLYDLITSSKKKASRLVELRNKLIKKYIGSDFYYIQTGDNKVIELSGVLFQADNPTGNLLNRHFPTTATIEEESDLQSCRRIGLFFTPEKNGILYYSVPEKRYKINLSKLESNKVYIYPDPERYGNTVGLSRIMDSEYPLIHISDYTKNVKNASEGYNDGDINSTPYNQDHYAYFSRNQLNDNFILGSEGLKTNLSNIYNKGILTRWTADIYGNQYGLFKYKQKKPLIDESFIINSKINECENYDGGPITFYQNSELLPEVIIASNPTWVKTNVWRSDYYYNILIESGVGGYWRGLMERGIVDLGFTIDGLIIDRNKLPEEDVFEIELNSLTSTDLATIDGLTLDNPTPITWDMNPNSVFNTSPDLIIDGLFYNRNPKNNLKNTPENTLDAIPSKNLSEFVPSFGNNYILSSIKYKEFDAGLISDDCEITFNFEDQSRFIINETLITSKTIIDTYEPEEIVNSFQIKNSFGVIFVKNIVSGEVLELSSSFIKQFNKFYGSEYEKLRNELHKEVLDFNIYNDFLWIRTREYMILDKISFQQNDFTYSGTGRNYIQYKFSNDLTQITNPFIFEDREYSMMIMLSTNNANLNEYSIIPTFYKINYNDSEIHVIEDLTDVNVYKNNSNNNPSKLHKINQPTLTYNSRNKKYCLMCTIEDQNQLPHIYQIKFDYNGANIFGVEVKLYTIESYFVNKTINFHEKSSFSDLNIIFNPIENAVYSFNKEEGTLTFS